MKEYKIHIQLGEKLQTFTTTKYERKNGYIFFKDKFGQQKEFNESSLQGIETKEGSK